MGAACEDNFGQMYVCEDNYGQTYVDVGYDDDDIVIHPDYDWQSTYLFPDMALVRLSSPVTIIDPVDIDEGTYVRFGGDEANLQGRVFTVVGAGFTEGRNQYSFPKRLQQVDVPFVSQSQCAAAWNGNPNASHWDTELCAGVQDKDACNGK
jgi:secreted trypsin-like serine protease